MLEFWDVNKNICGESSGAQKLAFMGHGPSMKSTNVAIIAKPAYEVSTVSPNVEHCTFIDRRQEKENFSFMLNVLLWDVREPKNKKGSSEEYFIERLGKLGKPIKDTSSKGIVVGIDGCRFTGGDMAEKNKFRQTLAIMALSAISSFTQTNNTAKAKAVNTARPKVVNTARPHSAVVNAIMVNQANADKPQQDDTGFIDSGCSRHMTGNIAYLSDFKEFDGGYVTFGGGAHGCRISSKRTLKTDRTDSLIFEDLVKDYLVRGLPIKHFENDQTCVACLKGKQHRASCKSKVLNPITKPLFMIHMDLFGPTFMSSLMHKKYCLVVTDDYSRFTWVFFLTTKDETSEILKNFIKEIENLVDKKVKIIRSDNGTEFKNKVMDDFCSEKADSKLPTTFWAEAVGTACYVQNRVLVVKPHNKTAYELFRGFKPALSFMGPFGCHVTIFNTLDNLGKFDGKRDEGFFVGYSLSSKAFRVYNTRTRRVEENLHIRFLENKPMIEGNCPKWLFDIDSLT
ncbi:retrovirus-related pol polyprotein from transposon TNT 1-94 [Tanacetum coccineum]